MKWLIKHEKDRGKPWTLYKMTGDEKIYRESFTTRESAEAWTQVWD